MKVKIKKLNKKAVIPKYNKEGDAGMDITAIAKHYSEDMITYDTGIALEIPEGFVGLLFPRSSIRNTNLMLSNSVGVIDSGYRGEIKVSFKKISSNDLINYEVGDRICQILIIPYPKIEFEEVDKLSETDRNIGGFGSTNR